MKHFQSIRDFYPVRSQFFLAYAFIGCLLPYLAIYLHQEIGLRESTIGQMLAVGSLAIVLSPVVMTAIADTKVGGHRLLGWIFLGSSACMLALALLATPWAAFVFFGLHMLIYISVIPLQDGLNFTVQKKRRESGLAETPYHQVRVWGTIGFIVPSLFLFILLSRGAPLSIILYAAVFCGIVGYFNTLRLPAFEPPKAPREEEGELRRSRLPTWEAGRVLLRPRIFIFCVAMFLAHMASAAYFGFYPLYLTQEIGLSESLAGLVFNFGVVVEIVFILAFGWAWKRFGIRQILVISMVATALRMLLLAAFPNVGIAVFTQLFHGLVIIALQVGPVLYLNSLAQDHFRNSIQGLFTMFIMGFSRVLGHLWAGYLAMESLLIIYWVGGVLTAISAILLFLYFPKTSKSAVPSG